MLEGKNHIHLIGIGGAGMRAIANILLQQGYQVSGSDLMRSPVVDRFASLGATIYQGHAAEHIGDADVVVVSTAIHADNPELMAAQEAGIPILHRSDVVQFLVAHSDGIAVAGAHGKTTTTSMLGQIFEMAGYDPTILIGGEVDYLRGNSKWGKGRYSIVEADESDGSFLKLAPQYAIITNIEDDHMDYYKTRENLLRAFDAFVEQVPADTGLAVVCIDNEPLAEMAACGARRFATYGIERAEADYRAVSIGYVDGFLTFSIQHRDGIAGPFRLQVPGTHNVLNATAAYIVAHHCGISDADIARALAIFKGAKRRFETKGRSQGVWVVDDYAHHPTEIEATLTAAKAISDHRVVCVFQPHRYTRTAHLLEEFGKAFTAADLVVLTDIYTAGESPLEGIDGHSIPNAIGDSQPVVYVPQLEELPRVLSALVRPNDLVITMGAGNIYAYGPKLLALLDETERG